MSQYQLTKLVTERTKRFGQLTLDELDIEVCMSSGYFNATKLCEENGKTIEQCIADLDINDMIDVRYSKKTWCFVHPHLLINVVMWCSTKYGIGLTQLLLNGLAANKQLKQINRSIQSTLNELDHD